MSDTSYPNKGPTRAELVGALECALTTLDISKRVQSPPAPARPVHPPPWADQEPWWHRPCTVHPASPVNEPMLHLSPHLPHLAGSRGSLAASSTHLPALISLAPLCRSRGSQSKPFWILAAPSCWSIPLSCLRLRGALLPSRSPACMWMHERWPPPVFA